MMAIARDTFGSEEFEAIMLGLRYVDQRGDDVLKTAARRGRARTDRFHGYPDKT
jgi:predicted DNA-binding transcriptional regulator YafY